MVILGIPFMMSFNQSACLLVDGEIIGWTEEERLSRNKHSIVLRNNRPPSILFPYNSRSANIRPLATSSIIDNSCSLLVSSPSISLRVIVQLAL